MPGAFLKGNSSFVTRNFTVDKLSNKWIYKTVDTSNENEGCVMKRTDLSLHVFKLKHIVNIHLNGTVVPSTVPYTGFEDSTYYLYDTTQNIKLDEVPTFFDVSLDPSLTASASIFKNDIFVLDNVQNVYYEYGREMSHMGFMTIDGTQTSSTLRVTVPIGFLPHHTYSIQGSLVFELL